MYAVTSVGTYVCVVKYCWVFCWVEIVALGEGMKILCIKDHPCSSINYFHRRIRVITNDSFALNLIRRKKRRR